MSSVHAFQLLLIEPHDDTRVLYAEYLTREGYEVQATDDGREGLARALGGRFEAIISETRLPGIDGYQLCQLLRSDRATRRTPVIFVTDDTRDLQESERLADADVVLLKPCSPETILMELRRIAGQESAVRDGQPSSDPPPVEGPARRAILSRSHQRGTTTTPPSPPPALHCPVCDKRLVYERSFLGGVNARHAEQWDYFVCPDNCGTFEYRQRTRKLRRSSAA